MNRPDSVTKAIAQILEDGLLYVRRRGNAGDPESCAVEADHLHNLPALLREFDLPRLRFYMNIERPSYCGKPLARPHVYETAWRSIEEYLLSVDDR